MRYSCTVPIPEYGKDVVERLVELGSVEGGDVGWCRELDERPTSPVPPASHPQAPDEPLHVFRHVIFCKNTLKTQDKYL